MHCSDYDDDDDQIFDKDEDKDTCDMEGCYPNTLSTMMVIIMMCCWEKYTCFIFGKIWMRICVTWKVATPTPTLQFTFSLQPQNREPLFDFCTALSISPLNTHFY